MNQESRFKAWGPVIATSPHISGKSLQATRRTADLSLNLSVLPVKSSRAPRATEVCLHGQLGRKHGFVPFAYREEIPGNGDPLRPGPIWDEPSTLLGRTKRGKGENHDRNLWIIIPQTEAYIMGSGTFDAGAYRSFSASMRGKTTDQIYASRTMHASLDPKGVKIRESRDSADNPNSTPLIVALDVTGSMGMIADVIAREGLGTLFTGVLDRKPITDPHVMFMGVGDANSDQAPLQVSQFEADKRIIEQLTNIYLEHGGGGNNFESYNLPWYFAAQHTVHDSLVKRGKRGYLFTVGDEEAPNDLTAAQIERFIGDTPQRVPTTQEMLTEAQRMYDVYHVVIEEGNHARSHLNKVIASWTPLLGQRVIRLSDYTKLAETIVSAIEVAEGRDAAVSASGWGAGSTAVLSAVKNLPAGRAPKLLGAST